MPGWRKRQQGAFVLTGTAPFVERARELAALRGLLKNTKAGHGSLVVITGEPGIGKTRLADHFAAEFGSPSAAVLWGRCHPDPDVPAYWPWKQIIGRYAERRDDAALQRDLGAGAKDIVPLVTQLALRFPEFAQPPIHEPPEARQRVFEGMVEFLKNAARHKPLAIVIDDLQWIDDASLSLLELLASECQESHLLVVAACRATDFGDSQTEVRIGNLLRNAHHFALNGFNEGGVAKLIRAISGKTPSSGLARTLYETTQGNPLFVDQLTRFIAANDAWDNVDLGKLGLPRELKLAIRGRLARFPERTRLILAQSAVLGKSIAIDLLARVVELSVDELLQVLDEPVAARILQEVPGSPQEYSFTHVLIRETLYEGLSPLDKAQIHRRAAHAILEIHGPNLNEHLSAAAHHFFQVARAGDSEAALEYCARAGDQAFDSFAYEEAVSHYRRALIAFDLGKGAPRLRCNLLLLLGRALHAAGDHAQAKVAFLETTAIARNTLDEELLARGALGFAGFWSAPLLIPDEQVLELLREACDRLQGLHPALHARLIARRVHEHWWSLTRDQARTQLDEALELAETSADANAIAHVIHIRHLALWDHKDLEGRLNSALRIVGLRQCIEKELVLEGYSWLMADELERGSITGFESALTAFSDLAQHVRVPDYIGSAQIRHVARDLLKGRLRDAASACEHPTKEASSGHHLFHWAFLRFCIHRERDTVSEVESLVRSVTKAGSAWPAMRYWLVCTLAAAGSPDARLEFDGISANEYRDIPDDLTRLMLLAATAEACSLVGSAKEAHLLYPYLLPFAGRHAQFANGSGYFDSVSHMLARLATQLEEWDAAEEHFSAALQQAQALGAGPRTAHIQFHWAVMLINSGRAHDTPRALSLLETADSTARHFELSGLIPKIEAHWNALLRNETASTDEAAGPASTTESATMTRRRAAPSPAEDVHYIFRCEGDFWTLGFNHETLRLKDSRGLQLIATLLRSPGTLIHALELATGSESRAFKLSSAGNVLDAKARDAYRKRLQELTLEQAEAEAQNDPPRAARARRESEILAQQLATALGIGGRSRKAAAEAERARINVTRSIRSAISRMTTKSPGLAHHLSTSIRTGTFCHYVPDPSRKIEWEL